MKTVKAIKTAQLLKWNARAAFVYGFGMWTTVGLILCFGYPDLLKFNNGLDPNEVVPDHLEKRVYKFGPFTAIEYHRKDRVSFFSKVSNLFKSPKADSEAPKWDD